MLVLQFLFWISLGLLFYCYAGYGLLVFLWNSMKRLFERKGSFAGDFPPQPVTIIITAYNEEAVLPQKIQNTLSLDYPPHLLSVIIVTDGSTDGTGNWASRYPGITWLHQPLRAGKFSALKRAMGQVTTPYVVFSDANTTLNKDCLHLMIRHFASAQTGGVAGEKRISRSGKTTAVGEAEGFYWQYESFLKKQDALFHTVVGAAGELFAIRTSLFQGHGGQIILDDFIISMRVCLAGYRILYEPGAYASESPSASLREEEKRKIRISAGAYQSIGLLKNSLNFIKYPLLAFQYISRRLLRWVFCPWMLIVLLVSNLLLALQPGASLFFMIFLFGQFFFYLLAILGGILLSKGKRATVFAIPFYFLFMNYCLVRGFIRFMKNEQSVLWERSRREPGF